MFSENTWYHERFVYEYRIITQLTVNLHNDSGNCLPLVIHKVVPDPRYHFYIATRMSFIKLIPECRQYTATSKIQYTIRPPKSSAISSSPFKFISTITNAWSKTFGFLNAPTTSPSTNVRPVLTWKYSSL